jgi:RNA polymerase sigma factor (sigma-70 family)
MKNIKKLFRKLLLLRAMIYLRELLMSFTGKYTEDNLVALLKQRDRSAFDYLYEHYSSALYTVILNIVAEKETASDILQEVFVKVWRQIDTYDDHKGRLFTWMLNIARNSAIDFVRSRQFKNNRQNFELTDSVYFDGEGTQLNIDKIGLAEMVGRLPDEYSKLVRMAYFGGLTHDEIAKQENIPLGTVKTRIRKALTELRKLM